MKKSMMLTAIIVISTMILTGCTTKNSSKTNTPSKSGAPAAAQKSGTTTMVGMISKKGDKFFIQDVGKQPQEIDSYSIDLNTYIGQTLTVQGQYSGNTLFVSSIK